MMYDYSLNINLDNQLNKGLVLMLLRYFISGKEMQQLQYNYFQRPTPYSLPELSFINSTHFFKDFSALKPAQT